MRRVAPVKAMSFLGAPSLATALTVLGFSTALGAPGVVLDGSFGASGALTGPNYVITAGMGRQIGPNLFQSFSDFNLTSGESATFTATGSTGSISNILARVTGGSASSIDGTITSQIAGANLFLLNPSGVLFGPHAQVNVTGSFVVGTPDYVKLADGGKFNTSLGDDSQLTSAAVSAFGFLSATPAAVSFSGTQLTMLNGTGLHVIAGNITLDQGIASGSTEVGTNLIAPGGNLTLFSAASAGEVPFSLASPGSGFAAATNASFGNITLQNDSSVAIDSAGGGSIVIRGGKLVVNNSGVTSFNQGTAGGSISMQVNQLQVTNGSLVGTDSNGAGQAGAVTVNATGDVSVSGSGSQISADAETTGNAGVVTVNAGTVHLDGGDIFSNTDGAGNAGTVQVTATAMAMQGNSRLSSVTDGSGHAGTVQLTLSGPLTISDTSEIVADTYTTGNGGDIDITAPLITMTGQTLISANTFFSTGTGGNINVSTDSLTIQGTGITQDPGGITATSSATGNAGVIDVSASTATLSNGAVISSASTGSGLGGSVMVTGNTMALSGGSLISASSLFTDAGSIKITEGTSLTLSGNSSISGSAGINGGDITLSAGELIYLLDSNIQAYAGVQSFPGQSVGGIGGNIYLDPTYVILDNSLISANDLSTIGQDGNIINAADFFFTDDSLLHATGTIQSPAPDLNLAGSLIGLSGDLVHAENELRERCAESVNHEFSSLIVVGRGGIETGPQELQSDISP